ncbi:hypothetical protein BV95_04227 [Sphingobium chlorophenolicum]|nr:hypothetical protein BV95_04227 [Sphingobium chlorophenolicum]
MTAIGHFLTLTRPMAAFRLMLLFRCVNCYDPRKYGRVMAMFTRLMDWFCALFACTAENDLRINSLIAHVNSDAKDR